MRKPSQIKEHKQNAQKKYKLHEKKDENPLEDYMSKAVNEYDDDIVIENLAGHGKYMKQLQNINKVGDFVSEDEYHNEQANETTSDKKSGNMLVNLLKKDDVAQNDSDNDYIDTISHTVKKESKRSKSKKKKRYSVEPTKPMVITENPNPQDINFNLQNFIDLDKSDQNNQAVNDNTQEHDIKKPKKKIKPRILRPKKMTKKQERKLANDAYRDNDKYPIEPVNNDD